MRRISGAALPLFIRGQPRAAIFGIQAGDIGYRNILRTDRFTGAGGGAAAKSFLIHLGDHIGHARLAFGVTLGQEGQMGNFRRHEQQCGAILTGSYAGAAADTGGGGEGAIGLIFFDREGVGVHGVAGIDGNIASGLDDTIKCATVYDQVLDDGKGVGPPGLDNDGITVLEGAHMQLAGGSPLPGAMRPAVYIHGAHPADAFAAIMVEGDGLFALMNKALVKHVEHLQKGHFRGYPADGIGLETAFVFLALLPPDLERKVHRIVFHAER